MPSFNSRSMAKAKECFIPHSKYSLIIRREKRFYSQKELSLCLRNILYCIVKLSQALKTTITTIFILIFVVELSTCLEIHIQILLNFFLIIFTFYITGADPRANVMASSSQLVSFLDEPIAYFVFYSTLKIFYTLCSI